MTRVRRTGREHELKTWPEPYQAIVDGLKSFEVRKDDRGYAVGDTLRLREWDPAPYHVSSGPYPPKGYSGRWLRCTVTYIARGWGLPEGLVVMGIGEFEHVEGPTEPNGNGERVK